MDIDAGADKEDEEVEAEAKREVDAELAEAEAEERANERQQGEDPDEDDRYQRRASKEPDPHPGLAKIKADADESSAKEMHSVEHLQKRVAEETKSKALGEMLGGLKMDLYMLRVKVDMLDQELSDGVRLEEEDPTQSLVYPVSVCMQCILMLTAQYFVVYTAMAVFKVLSDWFKLRQHSTVELALQGACETVFYAPMLCVLFLGAQLRAAQISQGSSGPPQTAETAMQVCAWSVFLQTLLVLAIPAFTGEAAAVGEDGILVPPFESRAMAGLLTLVRYTAMTGLCVGFLWVCVSVIIMDARTLGVRPVDLWDDPTTVETEYAPPVGPAMSCTISLTQLFFLVYLVHAILRTLVEFSGGSQLADVRRGEEQPSSRLCVLRWEHCARTCTYTMSLAPMVCILFMAARIRALELDSKLGETPWWTKASFQVCAWAIAAQVLVIVLAHTLGVQAHVPPPAGVGSAPRPASGARAVDAADKEIRELALLEELSDLLLAEASTIEKVMVGIRGLCLFVAYCAILVIIVGVVSSKDLWKAPDVAPAMGCVLMLACLYFTVYVCLFAAQSGAMLNFSFSRLTHAQIHSTLNVVRVFKMAEYSVKLCPMTAILFIGARMRALHLSDYKGSSQCWAQDAMYTAATALLMNVVLVLVAGGLSRNVGVDEAGSPVSSAMKYLPGRVAVEAVRSVTFLLLFGGVAAVGLSVLTIRPETAGCPRRGYYPLVK